MHVSPSLFPWLQIEKSKLVWISVLGRFIRQHIKFKHEHYIVVKGKVKLKSHFDYEPIRSRGWIEHHQHQWHGRQNMRLETLQKSEYQMANSLAQYSKTRFPFRWYRLQTFPFYPTWLNSLILKMRL